MQSPYFQLCSRPYIAPNDSFSHGCGCGLTLRPTAGNFHFDVLSLLELICPALQSGFVNLRSGSYGIADLPAQEAL